MSPNGRSMRTIDHFVRGVAMLTYHKHVERFANTRAQC